jgi:predicted RNase H-like HicB family nuclease
MKKTLAYYLSLNYPIKIERMPDGQFCASIPMLKGCKGYGSTTLEALEELSGVKETLLELMLEQDKSIPEPTVELAIPVSEFERLPNRRKLKRFVKM